MRGFSKPWASHPYSKLPLRVDMRLFLTTAIVVVSAADLAGCAHSTGVLPAAPDTYTVSEKFAPVRGGSTEAERVALTEANDFCTQKQRQFVPTTMGQAPPTGYTVTFRCLLSTDPAVAQYHLQSFEIRHLFSGSERGRCRSLQCALVRNDVRFAPKSTIQGMSPKWRHGPHLDSCVAANYLAIRLTRRRAIASRRVRSVRAASPSSY